ncbi:leucyl/phenylalanyl-tRNA--protein transferase [Gynurincola endophyticus]|uniref:leucyl/phenylalanyl-tRNA--protein transferase n=1 Tax=Gynurincola endophyticus TaxID=2479004 RepID=UPI000F8E1037|nr:leucyl/phenylalanyl-tRNA--protein transferase [Gynurincola endophyticus]
MAIFALDQHIKFPDPAYAEPDGLLAVGGDLSPERIISAYTNGIFPWYNEPPILWWSPNPRCIIYPDQLKISKSMRPYLNQKKYEFSYNTSFREVITACQQANRKDEGTWISEDVIEAYTRLFEMGYGICGEAWKDGQLVGGLYGLRIGNVYFGESMFSIQPNASKFAFIRLNELLKKRGVTLIDCQVWNPHLETLGAIMIERTHFLELLNQSIQTIAPVK